jgi:hypothetical protein
LSERLSLKNRREVPTASTIPEWATSSTGSITHIIKTLFPIKSSALFAAKEISPTWLNGLTRGTARHLPFFLYP